MASRAKRKEKRNAKRNSSHVSKYPDFAGDYKIEEYSQLCDLLPEDMVAEWDAKLEPEIRDISARIEKRVRDTQEKILAKKRKQASWRNKEPLIEASVNSKLIDYVARFYERRITIDGSELMVIPMMQLYVRAGPGIGELCNAFDASDEVKTLTQARRNEVVCAIICEGMNATLFKVIPETDDVPTLVVVGFRPDSHPMLKVKHTEYPHIKPEKIPELKLAK